MNGYLVGLSAIYVFYVAFESLGSIARFGGFKVGYISVGLSLQNQILSINRLLGFMIAPMVGFFADKGGTITEIFFIGTIGSLVGGVSLLVVYFNWSYFSGLFSAISSSLVENGYSLKSFFVASEREYVDKKRPLSKIKLNFFFAQMFTTGLAMPSVFLLNIIAIKVPAYAATFLQMTTVISGVGNLILNFYTAPLLSVEESTKERHDVEDTHKSIFLGKIMGMLILSPIMMCSHFLL